MSRSPRRDRRARELGFGSASEQANAPLRITGPKSLARLPDAAQRVRADVLDVVAGMRRERTELGTAAGRASMSPDVVRYYAGPALRDEPGGGTFAMPADRLYRPMVIISNGELVEVDVRGSRVASTVSAYWNAVEQYLEGDDDALRPFVGVRVAGYELEADGEVIEELARRGGFSFESIYRLAD